MGNSIALALLSTEADYMRGVLNAERPYLSNSPILHNQKNIADMMS